MEVKCYDIKFLLFPSGGVIIPKVGDTVPIGGVDYLVVHIDETNKHMYFAKKYWEDSDRIEFDSNAIYEGSTIHEKCKSYFQEKIPDILRPLFVTLECGYGCPTFIPTLAQVASTTNNNSDLCSGEGEWEYFNSDERRVFENIYASTSPWWLQTPFIGTASKGVCFVQWGGQVYVRNWKPANGTAGFRPCFAMDMSILDAYSKFEAWKSIL